MELSYLPDHFVSVELDLVSWTGRTGSCGAQVFQMPFGLNFREYYSLCQS